MLDREVVASLLLSHWDVLAVDETDAEPASEYLHEADQILALLHAGHGADDLATYLGEAASGMGSVPDEVRDRHAATAIWTAFTDPR